MASGYDSTFSLLVSGERGLGRNRVYPPSFPRPGVYPHLFRVHKCAEGETIVSSSRRHPFRRIAR